MEGELAYANLIFCLNPLIRIQSGSKAWEKVSTFKSRIYSTKTNDISNKLLEGKRAGEGREERSNQQVAAV